MTIAIISDLHSNLEALNAVLNDIEQKNVTEIVCLGDLVGYGPNPIEVIDHAMRWKIVLIGNHDHALVHQTVGFNPVARSSIEWTRDELRPGFLSSRKKKNRWAFMNNLPKTHTIDRMLFCHGSPRDPIMEYILRSDTIDLTGEVPEKIAEIFEKVDHLCFVGHTHDPGIITEESDFLIPSEFGYSYVFEPDKKYVINVGSVGQPRDGDPRASYVLINGEEIEFRRVEYDFSITKDKIFQNERLDKRSGERLLVGK